MGTARVASVGLALALSAAGPSAAQDSAAPEATELQPMTVTAPVSPLDRSRHLLRLLVEQSAPCLGCDAAPVHGNAVLDYLLTSEPPEVSQAELLLLDIKLKDSPELEFLRP